MTVGAVVRETILLQQAFRCSHEWGPYSATEEQCVLCTIIATPEGKRRLEEIYKRARP